MKRFADFVGMQNHLLIFTLSCALLVISDIQIPVHDSEATSETFA
jgi:hypothetical protein